MPMCGSRQAPAPEPAGTLVSAAGIQPRMPCTWSEQPFSSRGALGVCSLLRVAGWHGQPAVVTCGYQPGKPHTGEETQVPTVPPHTDTAQI